MYTRLNLFCGPIPRAPRCKSHRQRHGQVCREAGREIIAELGNGFAALHFLLVARKSLDGQRYLDLALSGKEEIIAKMLGVVRRMRHD